MTRALRRNYTRRLASEKGSLTLIELLIASALMLAVFGTTVALIPMVFRQSQASEERQHTIQAARNGVERMLREVRTARSPGGSSNAITYTLPSGVSVRIECTPGQGQGDQGTGQGGGDCRRFTVPPGLDDGDKIIENIANPGSVFCITQGSIQARGWVGVHLQVNVPGSTTPITLDDGTSLRNVTTVGVIEPCTPS